MRTIIFFWNRILRSAFLFLLLTSLVLPSLDLTSSAYARPFSLALNTIQHSVATTTTCNTTHPAFAWFFGYIGKTFYPQTELDINQSQMISVASNLSSSVGGPCELRLVSPVNELPGSKIPTSMNSNISSYVAALHQYASVIYGRLDLLQFNSTTTPTIYQEVSRYINTFGLDGVWLDHAAVVYGSSHGGQAYFNTMMQNLSSSFPNASFILNQAVKENGYITPLSNDTWQDNTYISPTVSVNTFDEIPWKVITHWNSIFPDRVLLHLDAFASSASEPMGIFANQSTSTEIIAIRHLALKGIDPPNQNENYSFLFPVMGSWTYGNATVGTYHGTLYNSLTIGTYNRSTIGTITSYMAESAF